VGGLLQPGCRDSRVVFSALTSTVRGDLNQIPTAPPEFSADRFNRRVGPMARAFVSASRALRETESVRAQHANGLRQISGHTHSSTTRSPLVTNAWASFIRPSPFLRRATRRSRLCLALRSPLRPPLLRARGGRWRVRVIRSDQRDHCSRDPLLCCRLSVSSSIPHAALGAHGATAGARKRSGGIACGHAKCGSP
jgi:hypothetical protein